MCLIAFAWRRHPHYRLALIANRDEFHARPTSDAGWDPDAADVYGGRDLVQHGGWLQASTRGRLAAVTNVRAGVAAETAPRSRGRLVRDWVRGEGPAATSLDALAPVAQEYGRFNLLALRDGALAFASNHPRFATHAVAPGLHAMSNGAFDAAWPKSTRATRALDAWLSAHARGAPALQDSDAAPSAGVFAALAPLFDALRDTRPAPDPELPETGVPLAIERALSPPFIMGETYGTRCSSVVLIDDLRLLFAERRFAPGGRVVGESYAVFPFDW